MKVELLLPRNFQVFLIRFLSCVNTYTVYYFLDLKCTKGKCPKGKYPKRKCPKGSNQRESVRRENVRSLLRNINLDKVIDFGGRKHSVNW